jgi:hypothetical protein
VTQSTFEVALLRSIDRLPCLIAHTRSDGMQSRSRRQPDRPSECQRIAAGKLEDWI